MKSNLSILGLYQWDNTLFDPMTVPAGVDKQAVVNNILMDCAELEVLYSNPDTMKTAISIWSDLSQNSWNRMQDALTASYSPVENYDRYEDWEDGNTSEAESQVAAYNDSTMANADRATSKGTGKHTGHLHGNIGVTTNQQMITEEMEMRSKYNMVDIITGEFKRRFCLLVY